MQLERLGNWFGKEKLRIVCDCGTILFLDFLLLHVIPPSPFPPTGVDELCPHGGRGIKSSHVIPQVPVAKTLAVLIAPLFALGFCIGEYYRLLLSFQVPLFLSGEFGRKFNHSRWQY